MAGGIETASAGHDVVMCPTSHCYFDYRQSIDKTREPPAIGDHVLPLEKVYGFDPIPQALPPQAAQHVLGAQGNVWSEYIPTYEQVEYMTYPRATALAEVVWSPPDGQDFQDFLQRLRVFLARLKALGVNYRDPLEPH